MKLFSDQAVEKELLEKVKEELEKKKPEVIVHNNDGTSIAGAQMAAIVNNVAVVTGQHDSLR